MRLSTVRVHERPIYKINQQLTLYPHRERRGTAFCMAFDKTDSTTAEVVKEANT